MQEIRFYTERSQQMLRGLKKEFYIHMSSDSHRRQIRVNISMAAIACARLHFADDYRLVKRERSTYRYIIITIYNCDIAHRNRFTDPRARRTSVPSDTIQVSPRNSPAAGSRKFSRDKCGRQSRIECWKASCTQRRDPREMYILLEYFWISWNVSILSKLVKIFHFAHQ